MRNRDTILENRDTIWTLQKEVL